MAAALLTRPPPPQTPTLVALSALLLLLSYLAASTAVQWWRLRKVPGPSLASVSSLWIFGVLWRGDHTPLAELGDKYGHLVRVGPNLLLSDSPAVLRRMSAARSAYGKDAMYSASLKHTSFDNMFSTTSVEHHDELKAKLKGPYSGRETDAMEPIVDGLVNDLIQYLRKKIPQHNTSSTMMMTTTTAPAAVVVDLALVSLYFTTDVITRLAFGEALGFLQTDSDVLGLVRQTRVAVRTSFIALVVPWFRALALSWPLSLWILPQPSDKTGFGVILRFVDEAVKKRCAQEVSEGKDLLGACVRRGFPQGQIASEMVFAMAAGSDTTGSAIRNTMLHLMTSPSHYRKLKETVARAIADGAVSSPITQEEARRLPFLCAVINEGLRMRPPAPLLFQKTVPTEGDVIDGVFLPGGTAIGHNLFPLMRSREHWGDDAALFRPERWLDQTEMEKDREKEGQADVEEQQQTSTANRRVDMERLVDLAFGYGRFGCAGKPLAMMELSKVFFELFRHFDFQLVNPGKPWDSEFKTVFMEKDFFVQITEVATS
ncbi:unnamed protein product [Discula destructiva]